MPTSAHAFIRPRPAPALLLLCAAATGAFAQDSGPAGGTMGWLPWALVAVLALVLAGVAAMASGLRRERDTLKKELASANIEVERLDERMKRRSEELDNVSGDLVKLDRTDRMTQLGNRRKFDEALNNEFVRLKRTGKPLSLVVLVVDHFLNYTSIHGQEASDRAQRSIGALLKKRINRVSDVAARLSDGEFALVLPETDYDGAKVVAEHLRHAVERLAISHTGSSIAQVVTVSVGVVTVTTKQFENPAQVLDMALGALDRAREAGRNRVAGIQRVQLEDA